MTREEIFKRMMSEAGFGESKLQLRSENKQEGHRIARIPNLKKGLKKKARLLFITELALPFDPATGEESDTYNADTKYRTTTSATTTALGLKSWANSNEALKNTLMRRAGVTEWDTSDVTELSAADKAIFKKYRVPRIFSLSVVHVNIPAMTKSQYGKDFALEVEYDKLTGQIVGEMPGVLKVNKLFRDRVYEELQEYQGKIDSGECKDTEQVQKDTRTRIRSHNPVSDVHPINYLTAIELPLTPKYDLSGDVNYSNFTAEDAKSRLVMVRRSQKIKEELDRFMSGDYEKFDEEFDFYVVDMSCPTEGDDTSDAGKQKIGQDTTYSKRSEDMSAALECWDAVRSRITEFIDGDENIEAEVRASMFVPKYSEEIESQIYTALPTVIDLEHDKYFTQRVLLENKEVINIAGLGDSLIDEIETGVSDRAIGTLDAGKAAADEKKYSLDNPDFQDDDGLQLDEVVLAE